MDINQYLTVSQVASFLKVSPQLIRRYCKQGRITCAKVGRDWVITQDDFEQYKNAPKNPRGNPNWQTLKNSQTDTKVV